ncbi:MAG TPA: P1 family peptidase [Segetibacter sp.]|jgi:L-aminopeptidase/D-esterase-like protein
MKYSFISLLLLPLLSISQQSTRARSIGIPFDGLTGKYNAITDVPGVEVGHTTIIEGSGKLIKGKGPVRTGVTAIFPAGKKYRPVFSNWHSLNGNGDMTGTHWITESGFLETPILITNTSSVGVVRDAALEWIDKNKYYDTSQGQFWYSYPVVAETYDGVLNDINGFHVKPTHVWQTLQKAKTGAVEEGAVGGGTGMVCHGFKGGIGTSSRVLDKNSGGYTVGVLVQANYGSRSQLTIAGVPVGRLLRDTLPLKVNENTAYINLKNEPNEMGSIIVVVATDAPLLPHQLKRITQRVSLGIGKVGGTGGNGSGDIFIAFSTANQLAFSRKGETSISLYSNDMMNSLFTATIQATEEAIINALVAGRTMKGINDNTVPGLPHEAVLKILKDYNRIK